MNSSYLNDLHFDLQETREKYKQASPAEKTLLKKQIEQIERDIKRNQERPAIKSQEKNERKFPNAAKSKYHALESQSRVK